MLVPALGTFLHSPCTSELLSSEEHLKLPVHWHRHLCQLKAMLILSVRVRLLNCNTLHFIKSIYVTLSLRRLTSVIWLSSFLQNNIQGSQRLCLSLSPLLFFSLSLPVSVSFIALSLSCDFIGPVNLVFSDGYESSVLIRFRWRVNYIMYLASVLDFAAAMLFSGAQ